MLTGKQRSLLKAIANGLEATVYIGKDDLSDNIVANIGEAIDKNELVKVKIQEGSSLNPKETANIVAGRLNAEFVQAIGRKFVLYKRAEKPENRKIEL